MADDYYGGGIPGPAGGYDSWGPPGPGYPGGLWIPIPPPPGFVFPTPPVDAQPPPSPPPNPQVGVDELPPPNTSDPAPLPNPGGEYAPPGGVVSGLPPEADYSMGPAVPAGPWTLEDIERAIDSDGLDGGPGFDEIFHPWPDVEWLPQFVPRPARPPPRRDLPAPWPDLPTFPFPRRARPSGPRRYPEIGPPGTPPLPDPNMIPLPLPDEMNPNPPPPWPRVIEFPEAPPLEAIPQPSIPAPQIEPLPPLPGTSPDVSPIYRPPPAPAPAPPQTAPAPQPGQVQIPNMAPWERWFVLPLTRRRSSTPRPSPLQEWIRARDVPPPAIGEQLPVAPPPTIQPVNPTLPQLPDLDPLTPLNTQPLSLAAQTGTREDECKCEDEDEAREYRPSNVVAEVKPFRRRMSLNSLENLR